VAEVIEIVLSFEHFSFEFVSKFDIRVPDFRISPEKCGLVQLLPRACRAECAILHATQGGEPIGKRLDLACLALGNYDFETVVMIKMYVSG
jgi:hypothetical protein